MPWVQIDGLRSHVADTCVSDRCHRYNLRYGLRVDDDAHPALFNYTPKEIVPSLLLSSLIGNILSSFFNHRLKNADFTPGGHLFKIVILIGAVGIAGSIAGATLNTEISDFYLELYIGTLITGKGFFLL